MEFNLFTDLSEEQQELTSGGGQLIGATEYDATKFEYQLVSLNKAIASGPGGSAVVSNLATAFVYTSAKQYLNLKFN
jgi:hypothetical protein